MILKGKWEMEHGKWAEYDALRYEVEKGRWEMENGKCAEYYCPSDSDIT